MRRAFCVEPDNAIGCLAWGRCATVLGGHVHGIEGRRHAALGSFVPLRLADARGVGLLFWGRYLRGSDRAASFILGRAGMSNGKGIGGLIGLLTILGLMLRVPQLGDTPLDLDEAFSHWMSTHAVSAIWGSLTLYDTVQPLYHVLLKGWAAVFGEERRGLRALSVLLGGGLIPIVYAVARNVGGKGVGITAAVFVTISPIHVEFSQRAEPPVLLVLLVGCALLALMRIMGAADQRPVFPGGDSGAWFVFVVSASLALLTHHAALYFWWSSLLVMLAWAYRCPDSATRIQQVLLANFLILVVCALWLPSLIDGALGVSGADGEFLMDARQAGKAVHAIYAGHTLVGPHIYRPIIGIAVGVLIFGVAGWAIRRHGRSDPRLWLLVVVGVSAPIALLSIGLHAPVIAIRPLFLTVVPLVLVLAMGIDAMPRRFLASVAFIGVVTVSAWGVLVYFTVYERPAWDLAAETLAAKAEPKDLVIFSAAAGILPVMYALNHGSANIAFETVDSDGFVGGLGSSVTHDTASALGAEIARRHRVWLVRARDDVVDSLGLVPFEFERRGAVADHISFPGVELVLYEIGSQINFSRRSYELASPPTAMAWAPDGALYVSELLGPLHRLTFEESYEVVLDDVIDSLTKGAPRLILGLAIDPESTPQSVIVWVSHSHGDDYRGKPNTGTISRLSGPDLTEVTHVITGLPRSMANHATNAIHFGPDGRLFIAQGGNTGAGAPNLAESEFEDFPEQFFSAALLVADVKDPNFNGDCLDKSDPIRSAPCDVDLVATGIRNMYDFVHHSNGAIYGADNGLGVIGSFPARAAPPCDGLASAEPVVDGGQYPGEQPDLLYRIEDGAYYGHPNPARDECVFGDGALQGVAPLPNYVGPIANLGRSRSSNGVIEFGGPAFCSELAGDLILANFVTGDLTRVRLGRDGLPTRIGSFLKDFDWPLPLAQAGDGAVFVGEFGASLLTVLIPGDGCWRNDYAVVPERIADPGGTIIDGRIYVVAGKTPAGPQSWLHIYDIDSNTWRRGPDMPGTGVEDAAVVAHQGQVYVFGGAPKPFSGALDQASVFDPTTETWRLLASLLRPRSGAVAQALNGEIYVVGGMDPEGASLDTLDIYDPENDSWRPGPSMSTRRDNPGAAVVEGKLYVFGGRTREADGVNSLGELESIEIFDPVAGAWHPGAPMPTGRRRMVVGVDGDRIRVVGGEQPPDGSAFAANEEYDTTTDTWRTLAPLPTPRHGAVGGTTDGVTWVVAGSPGRGIFAIDAVESFSLDPH